jgi:hypothetical protein
MTKQRLSNLILISSDHSVKLQPEIIRFLEKVFTQNIAETEECKYQLSAVIAEYFYHIQPCCGLIYPTTNPDKTINKNTKRAKHIKTLRFGITQFFNKIKR